MTLRERLIALADADAVCDDDKPYTRALALAAAKMALERAAKECDGYPADVQPHICAEAIRVLRDGLKMSRCLLNAKRENRA